MVFLLLFCLFESATSQENSSIRKIKFFGNDTLKQETLLKQMNVKPQSFTEKLSFWKKKTEFSNFTLDEDIIRLKKLYQQNGFLNPKITYELLPNKNNKKTDIKINVTEGDAVRFDSIKYIVKRPLNNQLLDSLKLIIPIKSGTRFRDNNVITSEKIIQNAYRSNGFPYISVTKEIRLNQQDKSADIIFLITPENKSFFGDINLLGDSLISKTLINKQIKIKSGQPFSQSKLEETQEKLFDLNLFRYVVVKALMDSVKNNLIPINIQLKELPRWSFKTGLGYGTEDKVRISMLLTRLNFLGGGRKLTIKGQHSYFIPLNIEAKFIQPSIWSKNLDFILNPFFSREREESYEVDRIGTAITFQKEFENNSAAYISYTIGTDKVELKKDIQETTGHALQNSENNKSGITMGYSINTTDNLFYPTKGWKFNGTGTYMGIGFNTEYHYYKIIAEVDFFQLLGEKTVFAAKVKSGIIDATQGDLQTPIEDRFLMGGALSLRGWGRNQISPLNSEGTKLGGNSMFESSAELRFPLFGIFSGTTFMDFGNVWESTWNFNFNKLHYNAGLGLRAKTPVGPIRFDVATPVFNEKFNMQFFITIGHAF